MRAWTPQFAITYLILHSSQLQISLIFKKAHAKLIFRDVILPPDAICSIISMFSAKDFVETPYSKLDEIEAIILKRLDLGDIAL